MLQFLLLWIKWQYLISCQLVTMKRPQFRIVKSVDEFDYQDDKLSEQHQPISTLSHLQIERLLHLTMMAVIVFLLGFYYFNRQPALNQITGCVSTNISNQSQIHPKLQHQPLQSIQYPKLNIEKIMWILKPAVQNHITSKCLQNNQHFAEKSQFQFRPIDRNNYHHFISRQKQDRIKQIIDHSQDDLLKQIPNISAFIDQTIIISALAEHGGVAISTSVAIVQDFSWMNDIASNIYVNRGNRAQKSEVFGFYSPILSPKKTKQYFQGAEFLEQVDRYVTVYPVLEPHLIAAVKKSRFIQQLALQMILLLEQPLRFTESLIQLNLHQQAHSNHALLIVAANITIRDYQSKLDSSNSNFRRLAIDSFGINLINSYYNIFKIKKLFTIKQRVFQNIAYYSIDEFEAYYGPIRYIVDLTDIDMLETYLLSLEEGKIKPILKGSLLQKIFYPDQNLSFIIQNPERSQKSLEIWSSLPKIIWQYWDRGIRNSPLNNQLCFKNVQYFGTLGGFQVREVNDTNLENYLGKQTAELIKKSLKYSKVETFKQTKSDLIRLALLLKYGGVYMDASYVLLEPLDWLINIAKLPSQFIFNRYGNLPKVFITWSPISGSPETWDFNQKHNTKDQWHVSFQNSLIAAEKDNQFIRQWFELLISIYHRRYERIVQIFQQCNISSHMWFLRDYSYLLPMDTAKCIMGRRQRMLVEAGISNLQSSSDYYKLWSMNSYYGYQKFRENCNYENPLASDNYFLYRYSKEYVEGLVGKIHYFVKFFENQNKAMSLVWQRNWDHLEAQFHPHSIVMQYMYRDNKLLCRQGKLVLKK